MEKRFDEESYKKHSESFKEYACGGEKELIAKSWFRTDTVGYLSIERRNKIIDKLLVAYPSSKWLTVGDGRYGSDANYLETKGFDVLATDISDYLLKEGKEMGYISKFKVENAEKLSFADLSFDFVLCKESFHHFPQPMKALYEMLRVCRHGVVLLEPPDQYIYTNCFQLIFRQLLHFVNWLGLIKLFIGKKLSKHTYESVGNYVYKISLREIEKVALGLNYKCVAYRSLNFFYVKGTETELLAKRSKLFYKVKIVTAFLDFLTKIKLIQPALMAFIIFKDTPNINSIKLLKDDGYTLKFLPDNPYL